MTATANPLFPLVKPALWSPSGSRLAANGVTDITCPAWYVRRPDRIAGKATEVREGGTGRGLSSETCRGTHAA